MSGCDHSIDMERVKFTVSDETNFAKEKHLRPYGAEARAVMDKLDIGEDVAVEIYRERLNKFAAKVEMVFQRIAKAKGMRVRNVRGWLAAMTGRADVITIGNKKTLVACGTGPRDMNADEFEAFWMDSREVIQETILPTLEQEDAAEIRRML